jgi:hypothetical protein
LLLDGNGLLFITDSWNNAVFQVDLNTGIINTVAGSPGQARGYDGDNGPATSALLNYPFGNPALDSSGNLYIADSGNNVIRQVNLSSGNIKTFAGTGAAGYSGDHAAALLANLSSPRYLRYDPKGDLYFSDSGNKVVRVIHLATGVISTVAGAPSASAVGDNGPALAASLDPLGLLVNSGGDLLVADYQGRIREIFSPQPDLYGNPVIAPLAQQMNHPILAPVPLKAGEPLCSYFDAGPKSSTWDVYNTVGTHVSTARFGTEPDQCLQTSGLITGVYMVRIQVQYVDDTVKSTWQKIVITK